MPTKRFLKIHFLQGPQGAYGSSLTKAGVWGSEQSWQGSRAPGLQGSRAPGLQDSNFIIIIIIIIIQIQILVNPELFISQ